LNETWEGFVKALELILSGDPKVYEVTLRSIWISGTATVVAALWGIPLAVFLGTRNFRGKFLLKQVVNALLGIPTVALGLIFFLALSRSGPVGFLGLLYTPTGIIIGEAVLIMPIIVSLSTAAIEAVDPEIRNLARTLGASESQAAYAVLKEALSGIFLAGIASFNRAIAELGIAWMVGGGIFGWTEVLTTGIALNIARGNIEMGIALGVILLAVVFVTTIAVNGLQRRRKRV